MLPSEANTQQHEDLVVNSIRNLMAGIPIDPEVFANEPTSADAEALRLLDSNTGRFAKNYIAQQKNPDPRIVKAMNMTEKTAVTKEETDMPQIPQMQAGGILGGDLPPEAIADGAVMNGAPIGEVNVPGGGGPTDDGVPTELPEGTFVLNAAAVEYHGTKHINDLIKRSIRNLVKKGVQITGEDINPDDDVPVAISNGEYIIPPEVARDVGIKKLEDMNERGLEYRKKVEETEKQKAAEQEQAMQSFMGQPMPEEAAQAPIQSETQMPMKDGDEVEATPPDEAEPEAPELTETERKILQFEKMKQEYFEKKAREEREMRLLERAEEQIQKDIEKGVTRDNPSLGGYGHPGGGGSTILRMDIAEGGRVPMKDGGFFTNLAQGFMNLFTQDPRDFETAPEAADALMRGEQMPPETPEPIPGGGSIYDEIQRRRESAGDPAEPEQMAQSDSFVPMYPSMPKDGIPDPHTGKTTRPAPWLPKTAQSGGTIERDPQATFLLPQSARQVQGLPVGANTYPTSPQEPFIGTPITGSVLANLPNAAPTPIAMQPQQGFVQPPSQKKSFEPDRLSFAAGGVTFTPEFWLEHYNKTTDPAKIPLRLDHARKSLKEKVPVPEEAVEAMNIASKVFVGDKGFTTEDIVDILTKTGAIESKYLTKKQYDGGPARSYWQVEPTTAKDLLVNSSALFGKNFEKEFSKQYGKNAAKNLSELSVDELSNIIENDSNLGATFAMATYVRSK